MAEKKKLGDFLKDAGLIDEFQLQSALAHQRNWGGKLGTILVELEFAREADIARIIAEKLKIPYVNLFEPEIPEAVLKLIKPDVAKKYHVVPLKKDHAGLVVAMADPMDIDALDAIRFATGFPTKPALAMESEIRDAIRKYYDHEEVVRKQDISFKQISKSSEKMELLQHDTLDMAGAEHKAPGPPDKVALRQETIPDRLLLDSLVSLLLEKELISVEDLLRMIEVKKVGL